ncbi:MAG: M55 family metallopeptidase [Planctomycetaceae bacterium]|nr:M55 family metallopeptidase [Planctomycetaceae bacterium]
MRIFISSDMEGITGVVHRDQLMPEGKTYEAARRLFTHDLNAVMEGALREAPDAEFVICDGHGVMRNIVLEDLHERAQLVIGPAAFENKPLCQCECIDDSFDLGFLVGFHTRAGTPGGLLAHTWVGTTIANFFINGKVVGEIAINASIMGSYGIPVGLVTGDQGLKKEAEETLAGGHIFAQVKRALGPTAALCMTPKKTRPILADAAAEAVRKFKSKKFKLFKPKLPVTMEVQTYRREMTDRAVTVPGIKRTGEMSFSATADSAAKAASLIWHGVTRAQDAAAPWLT